MTSRLPAVLSTADLPRAELCALRLDGEVYDIDDCVSPIDEICSTLTRAAALGVYLPARLVAEQRSAAWVWGATLFPPTQHQVCADIAARTRPVGYPRLLLREVVLDPADVDELAGLRLTNPVRTVVDLARFSACFEEDADTCRSLALLAGITLDDCEQLMNRRRNLPNKKLALRRLARALVGLSQS
jgi:hypothetical protein